MEYSDGFEASNENAASEQDIDEFIIFFFKPFQQCLERLLSSPATSQLQIAHKAPTLERMKMTRQMTLPARHHLDEDLLSIASTIYSNDEEFINVLMRSLNDIPENCDNPESKRAIIHCGIREMIETETTTFTNRLRLVWQRRHGFDSKIHQFLKAAQNPNPAEIAFFAAVTRVDERAMKIIITARHKAQHALFMMRHDASGGDGGCAALMYRALALKEYNYIHDRI